MVRPTKLPNWADTAGVGDIVEPTEVKKSAGWEKVGGIPEKPPYQYFNYWQNSVYNWVNYLDAAVTAFATQDLTLRLDTPTLGQTLAIGDVNAAVINIGKTGSAVNILGTLKSSSILLTCALAGITTVARANSANANAVTIPDFTTNTLASVNNGQTFTGLQTFTDSIKLLNKTAAANTLSWQTGGIFSFGTGATISEAGVSVFNTSVSSPSILITCALAGASTITRANSATSYALTLPSANSALAALDIAQTFSLVNTFSAVPIFTVGINTALIISGSSFELRTNTSNSVMNITSAGSFTFGNTSATPLQHMFKIGTEGQVLTYVNSEIHFGSIAGGGGYNYPTINAATTVANVPGLTLSAGANDSNNYCDMLFDVRQSTNSDFTTLTSTAFIWRRHALTLASINRNSACTFGQSTVGISLSHVFNGGFLTVNSNIANNVASTSSIAIGSNGKYGSALNPKTAQLQFLGGDGSTAVQIARIYSQDKRLDTADANLYFETSNSGVANTAAIFGKNGSCTFGNSTTSLPHVMNVLAAGNKVILNLLNLSYNSASPSGQCKLQFGWADHAGAGISAEKYAPNTTGLNFYSETNYWVESLVGAVNPAGSWTFGPTGYGGAHYLNGSLYIATVTGSGVASNSTINIGTGGYASTGNKVMEIKFLGGTNAPGNHLKARIYSLEATLSTYAGALYFETNASSGFNTPVSAGIASGDGGWTFSPINFAGSNFFNTGAASGSAASGLQIDGTYSNPTSFVNIRAKGTQSGGGFRSQLRLYTSYETNDYLVADFDYMGNSTFGRIIATTGSTAFFNTTSADGAARAGLQIDGSYSNPTSTINIRAKGTNLAGFNSTLKFWTTSGVADVEVGSVNKDANWTFVGGCTLGANATTPTHRINTTTGTGTGTASFGSSNAPVGGTPTGWINIMINGVTSRYIPFW
jgi:hypothetical protein